MGRPFKRHPRTNPRQSRLIRGNIKVESTGKRRKTQAKIGGCRARVPAPGLARLKIGARNGRNWKRPMAPPPQLNNSIGRAWVATPAELAEPALARGERRRPPLPRDPPSSARGRGRLVFSALYWPLRARCPRERRFNERLRRLRATLRRFLPPC